MATNSENFDEILDVDADISIHTTTSGDESINISPDKRLTRSSAKTPKEARELASEDKERDETEEVCIADFNSHTVNSDSQNIKSLQERGRKPGDHGYILQPKGVRPKAAILTIKTADTLQPINDKLFTMDIIEATVKASAGKARCQAKTILKLSPVNVLIATPRGGTLIALCDDLMSTNTWIGTKVKMQALIVGQEEALSLIEAFEAREADKMRVLGDPRDEGYLRDRKEGESPRYYVSPQEEVELDKKREKLRKLIEKKKHLRKPEQVIRASQFEDQTPIHVPCKTCGGLGHNSTTCPTRLLFAAAEKHGKDPMVEEGMEMGSDTKVDQFFAAQTTLADTQIPSRNTSQTSTNSQNLGGKPPKLPKFSGDSSKDAVSFAQWQFEVQTHALNYTESKMKEAIVVALTGMAADIVRMMGRAVTVPEILEKLRSIYGTVGSLETMLEEFYSLEQDSNEEVAKFASRVETMAGTIREHFPGAPVVIRDRFFKGLRERIQNRLRHKFDDPGVDYMSLLQFARRAEKEISQRYKDSKKDKAPPAKKGGLFANLRTNQAQLSIPEEPMEQGEEEQEPLPGEDPVDRIQELEKQLIELKRAGFGTAGANGPARPTQSTLKPTAPAFQPKTTPNPGMADIRRQGGTPRPFYSQDEQPQKPVTQEEMQEMLKVVCYNCRGVGHYASKCPTPFKITLNGQVGSRSGGPAPGTQSNQAS